MSTDRRDDERLGDPAVEQPWRAAATDEPSAQRDATILAAARAATVRPQPASSTPAAPRWWTHWQPLAAAAGVAGLAFSIVQMLPRDQDVRLAPPLEAVQSERAEVTTQDNSAAPAAPAAPTASAEAAAATEREPAPQPAAAAKTTSSVAALPVAPAAPAPAPLVGPATASAPAAAAGATVSTAARDAAVQSAESDAYAARGVSRTAQESPELPAPAAWARRIEALHAAGDDAAAADALRAFRAAYPDADQYLPGALQPWAATLKSQAAPVLPPE